MKNKLRCVLFRSRNKDNQGVEGFKQRTKTFLSSEPIEKLKEDFKGFVEKGVHGEFSRFYISVNVRDEDKIKKELMHELINDNVDLEKVKTKLVSIAAQKKCASDRNWLFDFDSEEESLLKHFIEDIEDQSFANVIYRKTPNGYAVIVDCGFDTRELLKKYPFVELKRDDLLCVDWARKEQINGK